MTAASLPLLLPCQGGWCTLRGKCANYLGGSPLTLGNPPDRLCTRGRDGESAWAVVVVLDAAPRAELDVTMEFEG